MTHSTTTTTAQTAFVTGGAGFLGRRLIRRLIEQNWNVRCLVRASTDLKGLYSVLPESQRSRIQFVYGDVGDRSILDRELPEVDVVFHLAAGLTGSTSSMFLNTVIPTRSLLEAAAVAQIKRFVLVSSLGVYGTQSVSRWGRLDETVPVDPNPERRDAYTFSKIRQEEIAWEAREQWDLPLVVVRPGVIYGPGRSLLTSRIGLSLGSLLIRMGGGRPLPYVFVENCAEAIAQAGILPNLEGEIFNVVDDQLPTTRQVLKVLKKHGRKVRSIWVPGPVISPLSAMYGVYSRWSEGQLPPVIDRYKSQAIWKPLRYSNEKAKRMLNWSPRVTTPEAMKLTCEAAAS